MVLLFKSNALLKFPKTAQLETNISFVAGLQNLHIRFPEGVKIAILYKHHAASLARVGTGASWWSRSSSPLSPMGQIWQVGATTYFSSLLFETMCSVAVLASVLVHCCLRMRIYRRGQRKSMDSSSATRKYYCPPICINYSNISFNGRVGLHPLISLYIFTIYLMSGNEICEPLSIIYELM